MSEKQNAALVALSRVLKDASGVINTPAEEILVTSLELRSRTEEPSPLPPAYFVQLGDGLSYWADTQGNVSRVDHPQVDNELRLRFIQAGGFPGWRSEYEADETTLPPGDIAELRTLITKVDFFDLPQQVSNGDPIPDLYEYTIWIAVGRNNKEVKTYDGTGPHERPALEKLIDWLKVRAPKPGPAE
jgi:hypothetical protein